MTTTDGLEFYDACRCAGTGCGGHLVSSPAFASITPAAHPCGTCGSVIWIRDMRIPLRDTRIRQAHRAALPPLAAR